MEYGRELIVKASKAASKEELLEFAKTNGIRLTEAEAAEYFELLHAVRELNDEELSAVAGGKGSSKPKPKYKIGQTVAKLYPGGFTESGPIIDIWSYDSEKGYLYIIQLPDFECVAWLETASGYAVFP